MNVKTLRLLKSSFAELLQHIVILQNLNCKTSHRINVANIRKTEAYRMGWDGTGRSWRSVRPEHPSFPLLDWRASFELERGREHNLFVLAAAGAKTMIGWNISRQFAVITPEENASLVAAGPLGRFSSEINADVDRYAREVSGLAGYDLADPVAMAVALDPSIITESSQEAMVVGVDEPTRGEIGRAHV